MDELTTTTLNHLIPPALNVPDEAVIEAIIADKTMAEPATMSETAAARAIYRSRVVPGGKDHAALRQQAAKQLADDETRRQANLTAVESEITTTSQALQPIEEGLQQLRDEFHAQAAGTGVPNIGDIETPDGVTQAVRKWLGFDRDEEPPSPVVTRPRNRIVETIVVLIVVLVVGAILGASFGLLTGLFRYADLDDGFDFSPRIVILFAIGPTIVWLTGEFLAHITRISRQSSFGRGFIGLLTAIGGAIWLAELLIEAYGFQDFHNQQAAAQIRVGLKTHDLPLLLYFVFAFIASSPYFGYKIVRTWIDLLDQEKAEAIAKAIEEKAEALAERRRQEPTRMRQFFLQVPAAQRMLDIAAEIQDRLAKVTEVRTKLEELEAKKDGFSQLSTLSEDLQRRLKATREQVDNDMAEVKRLTGTVQFRPSVNGRAGEQSRRGIPG